MNVSKYGVKCGPSLRFWENRSWINIIDPYGWFQWYSVVEDQKMIKDKLVD